MDLVCLADLIAAGHEQQVHSGEINKVASAGIFLFFGLWHFLALLFVLLLLPETRGIPLEHVSI